MCPHSSVRGSFRPSDHVVLMKKGKTSNSNNNNNNNKNNNNHNNKNNSNSNNHNNINYSINKNLSLLYPLTEVMAEPKDGITGFPTVIADFIGIPYLSWVVTDLADLFRYVCLHSLLNDAYPLKSYCQSLANCKGQFLAHLGVTHRGPLVCPITSYELKVCKHLCTTPTKTANTKFVADMSKTGS